MKRTLLVVGGLVGAFAIADYDYLTKGYVPGSAGELKTVLTGTKKLSPEEIAKFIEEEERKIPLNKEVKKRRSELQAIVKDNDALIQATALVKRQAVKEIEERAAENDAIANAASKIGAPNAFPGRLNSNLLDKACPKIDFSASQLSTDQLADFSRVKTALIDFSDREDEKLSKTKDKAAFDAIATLEKSLARADKADSYDSKEAQVSYLGPEQEINGLKKETKSEKEKRQAWLKDFVQSAVKARQAVQKLNKSDREMLQLASTEADALSQKVRNAMNVQITIADDMRGKCETERDSIATELDRLSQSGLDDKKRFVFEQHKAQYESQLNSGLSCPDVTQNVIATWQPIFQVVGDMRNATNARTLLSTMTRVGDAVVNMQSQLEVPLNPLIDSINYSCRSAKVVKDDVSRWIGGGNGQSQLAGGSYTPASRNGFGFRPNHNFFGRSN